eukprot:CAMPEP_0185763428 /NCGR_PEP_ID=MMETSP1174-20130828/22357_1 /TAXON_ID=35687 /ORGANISM="Dictyocha speculum, Strain CCMP1381" /LENGTH=43 /DNA_ID= /DNA_START= /DNA_END= /DNA_ORIENTATION=
MTHSPESILKFGGVFEKRLEKAAKLRCGKLPERSFRKMITDVV